MVEVVDDCPSPRAMALSVSHRITPRAKVSSCNAHSDTGCSWTSITENDLILPPQIVFGSGDTLRTLTLTANGGFVRAAAHQVLEHRTFFGVVTVYAYREIPHKSLIVGNFLISDVFPLVLGHSHQ